MHSTFQFVWGYDPIPYDDPFFHDLYRELKWKWKVEYQAQLMALRFSAQISSFLRHRDDYDMVVLYEDILGDPKAVCEELLEVCEVPKEYVPIAMEALETDSQKGTFGKRGDKPKVDDRAWDLADRVFQECGLPIESRMEAEEFKKVIVSGTYEMKSERQLPSKDYKRIGGREKWFQTLFGYRMITMK